MKSLQFSNSSNRLVASLTKAPEKMTAHQQMVEDLRFLMEQNSQLSQACQNMQDDIVYLRLREKKVTYLIYLLQGKGYPVNELFEKEVKPIPTNKF
mmetsp:Transcript_38779/g.37122  ORF Transcript_38779/g.37122 Transcript_38779/m.37122 type:complete len:96 (-) Transcript_38779:356-643(-)